MPFGAADYWVLWTDESYRTAVVGALIDNWILSRRIKVNETMELDSPEAIASMVHSNLGVSIVPDLVVAPQDVVPVKRLDLGPDAPHRTLGLVHRENQPKAKAIDELYQAILSVVANATAKSDRTVP